MTLKTTKIMERLKKITTTKYGRVLIDFSIITCLAIIIFRNWIFTNEWPAGGDILGWISRPYLFGNDMRGLSLWRPYSFGFVEGINSMDLFLTLTYWSCGDPAATIKIFTFSLFLVAGFSMYVFAYRYSNRHLAALSASLIYTLNQWFFTQLTEGHVDIIFSYAFFPLVLLLVDRVLNTKSTKDILLTALALSLFVTGFHPEFVVIYGVSIVLFGFFHMLASARMLYTRTKNLHNNKKPLLRNLAVTATSFFLISSFWLIPFIANTRAPYLSPTYMYPIEDAMLISYQNITDAFVLRAWEVWGYVLVVDLRNELGFPGFPAYALLLIIFSICFSTPFFRRDRYTLFSAFSIIISVIIATGPNSPFGSLFIWAWFNIPHFAVFKAASRWIAIAAFCYAFLVSVFVSLSTSYIKKIKTTKFEEVYLKFRARLAGKKETLEVYGSIEVLNKAIKYLHKFFYYFAYLFLILIFLSGFLSCYYFFNHGLQVYTPPQTYLEPYNWIAINPGDYKIVTVSNSPSEWLNLSYQESDFAYGGMLTTIGWGHDLGFDSSFIHDKPTLQDGGWNPSAHDFVDYLRFRLAREFLTKNLAEMLGTFGYKFIVLPVYASDNIKTFFFNQRGVRTVFTNNSVILENEFLTPRIFTASEYAIVIGGLEAFPSLCAINSFELNKTALIFANQVEPFLDNPLLIDSDALVFVNSDIVDLIMLSLKEDATFEYASTYAAASINPAKYWTNWPSWRTVGGFTLGRNTATTCGNNTMNIPFQLSSAGTYDIWVRVGFADWRGELSVYVDKTQVGKLRPSSNYWSKLMWLNLTRLELTSGQHIITLINDGTGYNDIDAIAVINPTVFKQKSEQILNFFNQYRGKVIYLLEAEASINDSQGYFAYRFPYEGYTLHSEGEFCRNIAPSANAIAYSKEKMGLESVYANDGQHDTRWSSARGMPQWLELNWPIPQQLTAIEIYFEQALGIDYTVETWDGEKWAQQLKVLDNYEQYQLLRFPTPVETTKLRIYVTKATIFDSVSIWEINVYPPAQKPVWSVKFEVPKAGEYNFALRLATGPDLGSIEIATENKTFPPFTCFNNSTAFTWYEETIPLDSGTQFINVTGIGKTIIDKAILYSRTDENNSSINTIFNIDTTQPDVSYEKVNPCKYIVHVNCTKPFLLIFSDSYHPLWKAYVDGTEISPITAYSFVNGFFINKTGQFDITIYFTGQTYADIGLKISATSLIITLAILLTPSKTLKKVEKHLMRGKSRITSHFKTSKQKEEQTNS